MKLVTVHRRPFGDDYQYFRPRKAFGTVVVEQPDAEVILDVFSRSIKSLKIETIKLSIGAAFIHPDDQLNKKQGRALAIERLSEIECTIQMGSYENKSDALWLTLVGVDDKLKVRYGIDVKIYRDDRKARVMGVSSGEWCE